MKPIIKPSEPRDGGRTGTLSNITVAKINEVLGFEPNVEDDPWKVKHSWAFTVDGVECAIWDYKGSEEWNQFSTQGPDEAFKKVFGDNYSNLY